MGGKSGGSIVLLGAQRQEKRDDVLVIKASSDSAVLALTVPHLWAPNTHWPQAREGVLLRAFYFHFFSSVCKAEPLWTLRAFSGTTVWGRAEHAVEHCCPGIMIPHQQGTSGPSLAFQILVPVVLMLLPGWRQRRLKGAVASVPLMSRWEVVICVPSHSGFEGPCNPTPLQAVLG